MYQRVVIPSVKNAYKTRSLLEGPIDAAIPLGSLAVFISMI
jgi:hypothetical protein